MRKYLLIIITIIIVTSFVQVSRADWIWTPESGKWVNPKYAVKDSPQEQFDYAMAYYIAKDYKKSLNEFEKLVKNYPLSRFAPDAQFYAGLSHENLKNYYEAFKAYSTLLEKYPKYEKIKEAVEREYEIGEMFLSGKKRKIMGLEILPAMDKAIEIFQDVVKNSPFGERADMALYRLGECYKKLERFEEAKEAFQRIADDYPASKLVADARFQIALCSKTASLKAPYTQEITEDAIEEFKEFVREHPDSAVVKDAKESIDSLKNREAESLFKIALFYEKQAKYPSAMIYYRDIIDKYPDSEWSAKSLAHLNIIEKKESRKGRK